jgi:mercuric reductase
VPSWVTLKVVIYKGGYLHIVAPEAADIINQGIYILKGEMTVDDVIDSLPVFPTLSEAIKIAALSFTTDITKLSCCV